MGFKGTDSRQSGDRIVFRASLKDSAGAKVTTGTASLYLYEVQSDGSLKSYDFSSNTFKTTALTTETAGLTHRTGNNGTTNTGIWTSALTTVTGFTRGGTYIAVVSHASASPPQQEREFVYGDAEGDFIVDVSGRPVAASVFGDVNGKILGNTATDIGGVGAYVQNSGGGEVAGYDQIGVGGSNLTALGDVRIGADTAGVTTLLSRFTAARAGYLDNLNVGGTVASSAQVQNIQNNTFVSTSVPEMLELPDSGSESISISILFNDETGSPKNLDSGNPTITLINNAGTDRSSRLGAWTNPSTGKYVTTYTNTAGDAIEGLHWDVTGTVNAKLRRAVKYTQLLDTTGVTFTASDRTKLTAIYTNADVATSTRLATAGYTAPPTAVQVRQEMDSNSTKLATIATDAAGANTQATAAATSAASADTKATAIQAKTDGLPASPASETTAAAAASSAATAATQSTTAATQATAAATSAAAVKVVTDKLNTMLTPSGGNSTFTSDALKNAPAGSGPGGGAAGSGADQCTITITDSGTSLPVADADVWITSDSAGTAVIAGTLQTNSNGQVTFLLDAGTTVYLWMQKDGENSIKGQPFVAVAD